MAEVAMSKDVRAAITSRTPQLWLNPRRLQRVCVRNEWAAAEDRFRRAARLLASSFSELEATQGVIESPLYRTSRLQEALGIPESAGALFVKADHELPVVGSIKARGGFHEVLAHAETLALAAGLLSPGDDLMKLDAPAARALFAQRIVAVGSTGNLGLSIGTIAAALGFRAEVHMSHDAKAWKKDELRRRGVTVVEHTGDYAVAVAEGRRRSSQDSHSYFVDDENSILLFEGYAAAAKALAQQLAQVRRTPSAEQPLCVYLPCGVGGAPGGICAGLSSLFGPHVLCFFAEPVASPCVLIGMAAGDAGKGLSVYDFGLDNRTEADGLAVPQASPLVLARVRDVVSGIFTVCDESLFRNVLAAWETEGFEIEPSAAAAFEGPARLLRSKAAPPNATHVLWTTGGALVPKSDHEGFRARGRTS